MKELKKVLRKRNVVEEEKVIIENQKLKVMNKNENQEKK